jgi:hypothetical protein
MERDGWICVACGDAESTLHVHHKTYNGEPWEVGDSFLQTLCERCHQRLGSHPKGGLWWVKDDDGLPAVFVGWCPNCASFEFADKGEFKCCSCGWDTGSIDGGILINEEIKMLVEPKKQKPKEYSLGWLKGMMTKIRKGGATNHQIFEAVFPNCPSSEYAKNLIQLIEQFTVAMLSNSLSEQDEGEALLTIVTMRRKLQQLLLNQDHNNGE